MQEIQPILNLISRHAPWVAPTFAALFALRVPMKVFNAWLQGKLTQMLVEAAARRDAAEDSDIEAVLGARWYRLAAWGCDLVLSLKLPHRADFLRMLEQQTAESTAKSAGK